MVDDNIHESINESIEDQGLTENLIVDDKKEQWIESLCESIVERILNDERFINQGSLLSKSSPVIERTRDRRIGREKNTDQPISLIDLVPNDNKKLKSILNKIPEQKQYLQFIEVFYREHINEITIYFRKEIKKQDLLPRTQNYPSISDFILTLLLRIEVFMKFLNTPYMLRGVYPTIPLGKSRNRSIDDLKNQITIIGYEFLYLLSQDSYIKILPTHLVTRNIQLLIYFLKNEEIGRNRRKFNIYERDVTKDNLGEFNVFLEKLFSFSRSGKLESHEFKEKQYRQRDGNQSLQPEIILDSLTFANKEWKNLVSQIEESRAYFNKYKNTNIVLLRTEVRLNPQASNEQKRINYDQFKEVTGAFFKSAQKPQGIKAYSDFLYFWDEDRETGQLVLDLISIFDCIELMPKNDHSDDSIFRSNFYCDVKRLMEHITDSRPGSQAEAYVEAKSLPINNFYEGAELLIEIGDRDRWKYFQMEVIPYFIVREFIQKNYTDEIKNRFKRGQKR